jgi:hypothetical protein
VARGSSPVGRSGRHPVPHPAYAPAGDTARARALLAELAETTHARHVPATAFAVIHLGLGENGRALDWIEEGCTRHELNAAGLKAHPAWDCLRAEPRLGEKLRQIGVV